MTCIIENECEIRTLIKPMRVVDTSGRLIETRYVHERRCRNCYRMEEKL